MYYIYILRCTDHSLYTGITTDVQRRFEEHLHQVGAKYTKVHKVDKIEAIWQCESRSLALKLEYWLKTLTKEKKEKIISDNTYLKNYLSKKIDMLSYQRL